jgi:5-methylcytosine-specific restriction endonuclease McrA
MTYVPDSARKQVRERANFRCEYCLPEGFSFFPHQVDHIIAVKHRGSSESINLAWACFECNNAKGSDIPSLDEETNQLVLFFNPRTQNWIEHFEKVDARIRGKTPTGRVTVLILQMNHPDQIKIRRELIEAGLW